jgi:uncharacterized protein
MAKNNPASAARYILVATALLLPTLSLIPLGGLYLWEKGFVLGWALAAFACIAVITLIQRRLIASAMSRVPPDDKSAAVPGDDVARLGDPTWSPLEAMAWADVKMVAARVDLDRMNDLDAIVTLGRNTIEVVAERLHPTREDAIWQFTLPEALAIMERVSRRLGRMIETNVPFGDRMTVSQFISIYRWRHMLDAAERAYDIWRLVRLVNPATAITNEARERLSRALFQWGREHVMRRLVEAYVEEVGRAAIDLYGGRLRIPRAPSEASPDAPESIAALARAPITVLVVGDTGEARELTAALLRMVEQDEARTMLASLDDSNSSVSTWDLVGLEVRLSEADTAIGKQLRRLIDEVRGADIIVWALPHGESKEPQRAALAAIADYFKATPSLLAPAVLPVVLAGGPPPPAPQENRATLSSEGIVTLPSVVIDPKSANPETDGARLAAALRRGVAHARRVRAVRWLASMKAQRDYMGTGWQAASAIGSAVRSIFWRRST